MLYSIFYALILLLSWNACCAQIPEKKSREYAVKFHEAFILQSRGQSTAAFNQFLDAFQLGTSAGESPRKLQAIANIFYWYRQHGSCMKIFGKQPSYAERISAEYCICGQSHATDDRIYHWSYSKKLPGSQQSNAPLSYIPDYYSEYGINPKQASTVREFMFGVGELISGLFIYCCSPLTGAGGSLAVHGAYLIASSLHNLYTEHEIAMYELKKLTDEAQAAATK